MRRDEPVLQLAAVVEQLGDRPFLERAVPMLSLDNAFTESEVADFLAREYQVDREGARTALFGPEPSMDELHRPQMAEGPKPARTAGRGPVVGPWGGRR